MYQLPRPLVCRGFNEAVNAFADEQWVSLPSDGMDDVSVMARANSGKDAGAGSGGVLCARASMLLQIVPPATLVRFMHDHRSEWADPDIDASTAAAIQGTLRRQRKAGEAGLLPSDIPLAVAMDDQEFLELVKLEGRSSFSKDGDTFLLQLCTCPDVHSAAAAQLVFAPVDAAAAAADVPLLPSGFRVIPVDTEELVRPMRCAFLSADALPACNNAARTRLFISAAPPAGVPCVHQIALLSEHVTTSGLY